MNPTPMIDRPRLAAKLQEVARQLDRSFLDKQELIRLLLISVVAGEHMVVVGPPGTAKSALVRTLSELIEARYFEYLLTRFTEPNELFGPVDMLAFREGDYRRRVEGMLPEAEVVFLDEVFKANSAILNSLLTLLNERRYANGQHLVHCPLVSVFGAGNEVPNDENLHAIFDRFLLRARSENLDSYHFQKLVACGVKHEIAALERQAARHVPGGAQALAKPKPLLSGAEIHRLHAAFAQGMDLDETFLATYKGLIFQIRSEGISVSDRRVVKMTKLFAASALFDGRKQPCDADFFVLKHIWNSQEQADLLEEIVTPVVQRYYQEHPQERRFVGHVASLDDLLVELALIRDLLTSGEQLSDIQLFSQLRNLNEIKGALKAIDNDAARQMVAQVDQLLDSVFASSKFA